MGKPAAPTAKRRKFLRWGSLMKPSQTSSLLMLPSQPGWPGRDGLSQDLLCAPEDPFRSCQGQSGEPAHRASRVLKSRRSIWNRKCGNCPSSELQQATAVDRASEPRPVIDRLSHELHHDQRVATNGEKSITLLQYLH